MSDDEPMYELTASDAAESDDFVRKQLILRTALESYFDVVDDQICTFFRDDLLGVGLFVTRGHRVMQALCRRTTATSQWCLSHLAPAPHWTRYDKGGSRLGVLVKRHAISDAVPIPDGRHSALFNDAAYEVCWDIEQPI